MGWYKGTFSEKKKKKNNQNFLLWITNPVALCNTQDNSFLLIWFNISEMDDKAVLVASIHFFIRYFLTMKYPNILAISKLY